MDELKQDVKIIRESQIRMEKDVGYHIKRTNLLEGRIEEIEEDIKPIYVIHFIKHNYKFITFLCSSIGAVIYFYLKSKGL